VGLGGGDVFAFDDMVIGDAEQVREPPRRAFLNLPVSRFSASLSPV
jgi:hypothetical protein